MKRIKYHCSKCNHLETEDGWKALLSSFGSLFVSLFSVLGVAFILFIAYVGIPNVQDAILVESYHRDIGDFFFDYRAMAINMSEGHGCSDDDSCYVNAVFLGMKDVPYVPCGRGEEALYPPDVVMGGSDCKNLSWLFTELTRSVGVDSHLRCSVEHNHCVSEVDLKDGSVWIVDLTTPIIYDYVDTSVDFWDFDSHEIIIYSSKIGD